MALLLLAHVPLVAGDKAIVLPAQTADGAETVGNGLMIILALPSAPQQPAADIERKK